MKKPKLLVAPVCPIPAEPGQKIILKFTGRIYSFKNRDRRKNKNYPAKAEAKAKENKTLALA
jgi:hypothetical protein